MSQYFENDDNLKSEPVSVSCFVGSRKVSFLTDNGVFSKGAVDDASLLLVRSVPKLTGRVLDLGCGYGFIGVYLKIKNPEISLVQSDVNRRALSLCKKNCLDNNIDSDIIESDGFDNLDGLFDTVVLNPPIHAGKDVVFGLYEQTAKHLKEDGKLYIVIRKKHGSDTNKKKLEELGYIVNTLSIEKSIFVFECKLK